MLDFTYSNITKIVFGRGAEEHAGKEAAAWGRRFCWRRRHIVRMSGSAQPRSEQVGDRISAVFSPIQG